MSTPHLRNSPPAAHAADRTATGRQNAAGATGASFGPQAPQVRALLKRADTFKMRDMRGLANTWVRTSLHRQTVLLPEVGVGGHDYAAWEAVWGLAARPLPATISRVVAGSAWEATASAARALAERHLIGTPRMSKDQYDALTACWRKVMGPLHPADLYPADLYPATPAIAS